MRRANQIRKAYGEFETGFCVRFNGDAKLNYPTLVSACLTHTPTLFDIDLTYGENSALTWVAARLAETFAFVGLISSNKNKDGEDKSLFTINQQIWCARSIISMRPDVTVSEVLQFFTRFEQGKYYIFNGYKHPNPQVITASYQQFLNDLYDARGEADHIKESARLKQSAEEAKRNAVPCPPDIAERIKKYNLPIKLTPDDTEKSQE